MPIQSTGLYRTTRRMLEQREAVRRRIELVDSATAPNLWVIGRGIHLLMPFRAQVA
ncbi:MAG: hypothetical protein ACYCV0_13375 [Desulfitobacteriaceae bacterium]